MTTHAVFTGDIVNSTKLTSSAQTRLSNKLIELFTASGAEIEFYRGDSFQVYLKNPALALRLALLSRTVAIKFLKENKLTSADIRISIGLGEVKMPLKNLKTAKGEAFIMSGRKFDEILKKKQRLAITSSNPLANEGLQILTDYLDAIFCTMTVKQAEVIFELLKGEMQKSVAKKIKKTKSTIHQRIISGRWPEIENLLQNYENIINLIV